MNQAPAAEPPSASTGARMVLLLAGAVVLVRWLFMALTGATFEDSFISLRYAENLAAGLGPVYNAGERVFGASTPLYVAFLAGLVKLGLPAIVVSKTVSALLDGVTFFLWARWLLRQGMTRAALFLGACLALSPVLVQVSVSGMETSFALLLLSLALLSDLEDRPALTGVSLGLLMLVRPEGILAAAVILGLRWHRTGRVPWLPAVLAAVLFLPWVAWSWWFYQTPIPNSIPAKAAAYNLHRPSIWPNLWDTLSHFWPTRGPWSRLLASAVLCPCLLLGLRQSWRVPVLRTLGCLFIAWWAYLVLPKTLLFAWYFPPLLLPGYLLAALGFEAGVRAFGVGRWALGVGPLAFRRSDVGAFRTRPSDHQTARPPDHHSPLTTHQGWIPAFALGALVVGMGGSLGLVGLGTTRLQHAERRVREEIGVWLRENTPQDARVALEPIGYIGYYSQRRVLDEVGLVSPEMVPLNRKGAGWFAKMLRQEAPDYVVERPGYLMRNLTLNSRVRMFASEADQAEFVQNYRAVATFQTTDVPRHLLHDYRFEVYQRRSPESAALWAKLAAHLTPEERRELFFRALTGPVDLNLRTAKGAGSPPRP